MHQSEWCRAGTRLDGTHSINVSRKRGRNIWVRRSARSRWPTRGNRPELCVSCVRRFLLHDRPGSTSKRGQYRKWLTSRYRRFSILLKYEYETTTSRCKTKHQESCESCTAKENDCTFAEKDSNRSREKRSPSCTEKTSKDKIKSIYLL